MPRLRAPLRTPDARRPDAGLSVMRERRFTEAVVGVCGRSRRRRQDRIARKSDLLGKEKSITRRCRSDRHLRERVPILRSGFLDISPESGHQPVRKRMVWAVSDRVLQMSITLAKPTTQPRSVSWIARRKPRWRAQEFGRPRLTAAIRHPRARSAVPPLHLESPGCVRSSSTLTG